jgi:uncharacterized protein YdeI (YjbR/CyaY-like superfamily)
VPVTTDERIDTYIEQAEPFAQPILKHLRRVIHEAVPEVEETTKWGMPFFEYRGVLCGIASFKHHATFTVWKGNLIPEIAALYGDQSDKAMGTFGRITSVEELPDEVRIIDWLRQAADLNARNVKLPQRTRQENRPETPPPDDLVTALELNEAARLTFEGFAPSHRREYIEWLEEAKTDATRQKRLATTIEQLSEGKSRHWKYQKSRSKNPVS